jgi:hypothetical protein
MNGVNFSQLVREVNRMVKSARANTARRLHAKLMNKHANEERRAVSAMRAKIKARQEEIFAQGTRKVGRFTVRNSSPVHYKKGRFRVTSSG